jgi:hypothetical protein
MPQFAEPFFGNIGGEYPASPIEESVDSRQADSACRSGNQHVCHDVTPENAP